MATRISNEQFVMVLNFLKSIGEEQGAFLEDPEFTPEQKRVLDEITSDPATGISRVSMVENSGKRPPYVMFFRTADKDWALEKVRQVLERTGGDNIVILRTQ